MESAHYKTECTKRNLGKKSAKVKNKMECPTFVELEA
jgi:hypothetical protein